MNLNGSRQPIGINRVPKPRSLRVTTELPSFLASNYNRVKLIQWDSSDARQDAISKRLLHAKIEKRKAFWRVTGNIMCIAFVVVTFAISSYVLQREQQLIKQEQQR